MDILGRWSELKPADNEVQEICDQVKPDVEKLLHMKFETFRALVHRTLLLAGGMHYLIQVLIEHGEDEDGKYLHEKCLHVRVFSSLERQLDVMNAMNMRPVTVADKLIPF
ncbi:cystatin-A-like isoform X1 [Polypterus senegalus]